MPFEIVRGDITTMAVDAIVNAANETLLGGGGVDGAIHRAAGPELLAECRTLGGCETGDAKLTGGYLLPAKYVIHTVGPIWEGGRWGEQAALESCYRTSLTLAKDHDCESVAFPLISAGAYGYPKAQALRVAIDTITVFLADSDMTVYLVLFDGSPTLDDRLSRDITAYIHKHYKEPSPPAHAKLSDEALYTPPLYCQPKLATFVSLGDALGQTDESFTEMLLRKIDEQGLTDVQCYKRANISRKLFSKIRSNRLYKPSKPTALAFAVALKLPLPEVKELLGKAGFALSHTFKFDIIVEYFIEKGNYNITDINQALFDYDQPLLGGN